MKNIIQKIIEANELWNNHEYCMNEVRKNGLNLKYVRKQTPMLCLAAVNQNGLALKYVLRQTSEICLAAVKQNGNALQFVDNQTPEICMAAVQQNINAIHYVIDLIPEIYALVIKENPWYASRIRLPESKFKREIFLNRLKNSLIKLKMHPSDVELVIGSIEIGYIGRKNFYRLYEVESHDEPYISRLRRGIQLPSICMKAVKEDGLALKYVKDQTPEICMEAVKENWKALQFAKTQIPEICMEAVKQDWNALRFAEYHTPEICFEALKQNPEAYNYIRLPEDEDERDKFFRELGFLLLSL